MASKTVVASPIALPSTTPSDFSYQPSTTSNNRRSGVPPVAPPRTSSTYQSGIDGMSASAVANSHAASQSTATMGQPHGASRSRRSTQEQPPRSSGNGAYSGQQQQYSSHSHSQSQSHGSSRHQSTPSTSSRRAPEQSSQSNRAPEARTQEPLLSADQIADSDIANPAASSVMSEDQTNGQRSNGRSGGRNTARNAASNAKRDKNTKFHNYILGNVIGEGEFGKVRLGWKQSDPNQSQVAIKIIKKESLGNNPNRLAKIHREVNILRGLQHSNIVRLYDMISDDSRIGIVLEYASGGELFDYILRHRYLKDNNAKRLFAQLISGVGYLHKKGIVHRDLKLENLLLDRNKNIIITDFGFANTFDSDDVLTEIEEDHLADKDYVKNKALDRIKTNGHRRGDLMQTSCGSPCYAAPELVVSDCLYTGRKVDVWSCGVILYAMLAGYLPFDDDPANPEGDNINLLYKYIVNTTLTFPEYVSPHARDLLRRILVPDPRKRADLFEVARHSWLSDYEGAVAWITSNTTSPSEVQEGSKLPADEVPGVSRSASVREPSKRSHPPVVGGLSHKSNAEADAEAASKAAKRRTVQVEYVAPSTQTTRERPEYAVASPPSSSKPAPTAASVVSRNAAVRASMEAARDKPLPKEPAATTEAPRANRQSMPLAAPSSRPTRDNRASTAENLYTTMPPTARPHTGGHASSSSISRPGYSQPAPPSVAGTTAQGKIEQPGSEVPEAGIPSKAAMVTGYSNNGSIPGTPTSTNEHRGHKRSNTLGDLITRNGSIFGKNRKRTDTAGEKSSRKYPPLSMSNQMIHNIDDMTAGHNNSRPSIESSRRSISFGLGKKRSGSIAGSQHSASKSRRYSLIAPFKNFGLGSKNSSTNSATPSDHESPVLASAQPDTRPSTQGHVKPTTSGGHSYSKSSVHRDDQFRSSATQNHHQGAYESTATDADTRLPSSSGAPSRPSLQKAKRGFNTAYDDRDNGAARRVMDFFRRRGKAREATNGGR